MDLKKSNRANLEKKNGFNIFLGLIISLSLILISFEWTTMTTKLAQVNAATEIYFDIGLMPNIRREEPKPKQALPPIATVIELVDDGIVLEEVKFFNPEALYGTEYVFAQFIDDGVEQINEDQDFVIVEEMPTFNGGDPGSEFYRYILRHLRYPEIAAENGVSGRVQVQFIVNKQGYVERVKVVRSVDPALDAEAVRVIMSSPQWSPGKQRGKAVNIIYTFPINFVLQ